MSGPPPRSPFFLHARKRGTPPLRPLWRLCPRSRLTACRGFSRRLGLRGAGLGGCPWTWCCGHPSGASLSLRYSRRWGLTLAFRLGSRDRFLPSRFALNFRRWTAPLRGRLSRRRSLRRGWLLSPRRHRSSPDDFRLFGGRLLPRSLLHRRSRWLAPDGFRLLRGRLLSAPGGKRRFRRFRRRNCRMLLPYDVLWLLPFSDR